MAIGGLYLNKTLKFKDKQANPVGHDNPVDQANPAEQDNRVEKLVAVSRCYRAESSRGQVNVNSIKKFNLTFFKLICSLKNTLTIQHFIIFFSLVNVLKLKC
jgi:hypothetical protein